MRKYFLSHILMDDIHKSMTRSCLRYPGVYLGEKYLKKVSILPYQAYGKNNMSYVKRGIKKNEIIIDFYIKPLKFLLKRLRPASEGKVEIVILPTHNNMPGELILLSYQGVKPSKFWCWLYSRCFVTGVPEDLNRQDDITFDFFAEAYDALDDKNISVFKAGVIRLIETYSSLKRGFSHSEGNYLDTESELGRHLSISASFHYDLRKFFREVVKTTETSGEYFHESMYIPLYVYRKSEASNFSDFKQFLQSLFGVWHVLNEWRAGLGTTLSASQEQTHQELIRNFISQWEGWSLGLIIGKPGSDEFAARLMYHLHQTVRLLLPPVVGDNNYSVRNVHDVLCLWYEKSRLERHWEEEYRWHSFFLTPDYLNLQETDSQWNLMLRSGSYNEAAAQAIIFSNALSDMRLLISAYIIANIEPQEHVDLVDLVTHLLDSRLYEDRGTYDTLTPAFRDATDIIDVIIRTEHYNTHHDSSWYHGLSETIEVMNSFNERPLIAGRMYSGVREDLGSLYGAYALLAIKLARKNEQVTHRVNEALAGGLFSYSSKCRVIMLLERLKRTHEEPFDAYIISEADYATNVIFFNGILDRYISLFNRSKESDIISAEVDKDHFRNIELRLTQSLSESLREDILLACLSFTTSSNFNKNWQMEYIPANVSKEYVSLGLNHNFHVDFPSASDIKNYILRKLHQYMWKLSAKVTMQVNSLDALLKDVSNKTADQLDYVLVVYGSRFSEEFRELVYLRERHISLSITIDVSPKGGNTLPLRINNCLIYMVYNSRVESSLLVRKDSLDELCLFQYPDGTLFNTYYHSGRDPLEGVMTTLWEMDMRLTGTLESRYKHI
ncbi:hypothetical protein [Pantoea rodasii]|nr:hypothetical protein [Pantoea rodasii]